MLDAPNMRDNDNSKKQDKQSSPRQKGFDVAISTQKLTIERTRQQREQEAKYASEHGVPTAHDILGSADFSQSKVPVSTFIETAHDILKYLDLSQQTLQTTSPIGHLSSNGLGFSAQEIIGEEVPYISGLY